MIHIILESGLPNWFCEFSTTSNNSNFFLNFAMIFFPFGLKLDFDTPTVYFLHLLELKL